MVLGHKSLKIGCGDVVGTALSAAPFHEQTVGHPAKHAQNQNSVVTLNPTAVVVVGDVQPLVQAALDPPALPVQAQPLRRVQLTDRSAGNQSYFFLFAPLSLAQEARGLRGHGKADVLGTEAGRADDAVFLTPFVLFLSASLSARRLVRGENPLGERILFCRC